MMIGLVQPGTSRGMLLMMIGSRKTTPPRMLRTVPLDAGLIGGDGRTLDAYPIRLDGVRRIDRDLVVGVVAILDRQIVILDIDIQVWVNQAFLDELPDDPRHLIAVELDDGALHCDLAHACGSLVQARVTSLN